MPAGTCRYAAGNDSRFTVAIGHSVRAMTRWHAPVVFALTAIFRRPLFNRIKISYDKKVCQTISTPHSDPIIGETADRLTDDSNTLEPRTKVHAEMARLLPHEAAGATKIL